MKTTILNLVHDQNSKNNASLEEYHLAIKMICVMHTGKEIFCLNVLKRFFIQAEKR